MMYNNINILYIYLNIFNKSNQVKKFEFINMKFIFINIGL